VQLEMTDVPVHWQTHHHTHFHGARSMTSFNTEHRCRAANIHALWEYKPTRLIEEVQLELGELQNKRADATEFTLSTEQSPELANGVPLPLLQTNETHPE